MPRVLLTPASLYVIDSLMEPHLLFLIFRRFEETRIINRNGQSEDGAVFCKVTIDRGVIKCLKITVDFMTLMMYNLW